MAVHGQGGGATAFFHEDEVLGKAYDARLMRRLLGYLRPYTAGVIAALVLLLLLSATQIAPPIIAKFIIDNAITPAVSGEIDPAEALRRLGLLGLAYLGVLTANAAVRYAQSVVTAVIGQRAMYDLRV